MKTKITLVEMLREVEWANRIEWYDTNVSTIPVNTCPMCGGFEPEVPEFIAHFSVNAYKERSGHDKDCQLNAWLAKATFIGIGL